MSLAQDLMGLGVNPLQAAHGATAGTGPLTLVPAGSTYATATKIGAFQYLCSVNSGTTGTTGLSLPAVGGDTGCLLGDNFVINNATGTNLIVYAPSGVNISAGGSNANTLTISTHTTCTFYAISTSQWVGVKGS
jgi:hypothetical protein